MTRLYKASTRSDASKITISTWVYISSDAIKAQEDEAKKLKDTPAGNAGGETALKRIPIMQFGSSIEPRVGIHVSMGMVWEGFLGFAYWLGGIGAPSFPDYICDYWIGGLGITREGWFDFAPGAHRAFPSNSYFDMWQNDQANFGGTSASAGCSFFYPGDELVPSGIHPIPYYSHFDDTGIRPFSVKNDGAGDFPIRSYSHIKALPMTWTWAGQLKAVDSVPRVSIKAGDLAHQGLLVNSEIIFNNAYPDPKNLTLQDTPTNGPDGFDLIRVDTGGTGKYFAFGDLVIVFPERPNITYGKPAIPSTLFLDGSNIKFLLTGSWPEKTTGADGEIVPLLVFAADGFVKDSWNHIFLTIDLTTMKITGGQDDPVHLVPTPTAFGIAMLPAPLAPPDMATSPKFAMYLNGKEIKPVPPSPEIAGSGNPGALLTVYAPGGTGRKSPKHWSSISTFNMSLEGGEIAFPIIKQEIDRYKVTGPNQRIEYAYTHIWFDKYIEPTKKNLSCFFWKVKNKNYNNVIPPPDKKAAVKAFGKPDVWFYRDKANNVKWQNLGTMGTFTVVGASGHAANAPKASRQPPPFDFRPGPGQPNRDKKPATTP